MTADCIGTEAVCKPSAVSHRRSAIGQNPSRLIADSRWLSPKRVNTIAIRCRVLAAQVLPHLQKKLKDQQWLDRMFAKRLYGPRRLLHQACDAGFWRSTSLKVEPRPSVLSTSIAPPWASAICFAMESPSPAPPWVLEESSL